MRDVFTMGARPIANMNALRFGAPDHPKTRHLVAGVVSGIGDYGNCMGVPTVGGETNFDARYNDNILVNAMCRRAGRRQPHLQVGGEGRRPSRGLCRLEDRARRHPRRHHGLGRVRRGVGGEAADGAGRRSLHREAAARSLPRADGRGRHRRHPGHGRGGPHLVFGRDGRQGRASASSSISTSVPTREDGMTAYEMMLSESQERMLMVLKPERREDRRARVPEMGPRLRGDRLHHRHRAARGAPPRRDRGRHPACRARASARRSMSAPGRRSRAPSRRSSRATCRRRTASWRRCRR